MGLMSMSTNNSYLALRLEGPLQSWGFDSQYNRRNTGLMPSKSGVAGMCCAALGYDRGSADETVFLESFTTVRMTAVSIPKIIRGKEIPARRMQDYHTVQNTITASGSNKDCHITYRQYLSDSSFGIILEGETGFVKKISVALQDPVWGIFLGRKTCIPSTPVFAGLKDTESAALELLIGQHPLSAYTHQRDVVDFAEGKDALPDSAVSFATTNRQFSPRRAVTIPAVLS